MPLLPGLQLDRSARVAVDLPGDIFGPAGVSRAGLGEAKHGQHFPFDPTETPLATLGIGWDGRNRRITESPIAIQVGIDDRSAASRALGPELCRVSQRECPAPPIQRLFFLFPASSGEEGRCGPRYRRYRPLPRVVIRCPNQARRLGEPRPDRDVAGLRPIQSMEIRLAQHGIFRGEPVVLERKDVRRNERIGLRQPALVIGFVVARHDQVEIEHEPVELALTQAATVEQHRPACRAVLHRDRLGHGGDARIDRLRQFLLDEVAQGLAHRKTLCGDTDEGQWVRGLQQDRLAHARAKSLSVEDHLARFSLDGDFVSLFDMDADKLGPAKPSHQAGEEGAEQRKRLLLHRNELERSIAVRTDFAGEQQLFQRGHEQEGETTGNRTLAADADAQRRRLGRKEAGAKTEYLAKHHRDRGDKVADAIRQAQRINALAAIEHDIGKAGATQEHADHGRNPAFPARKGNQLPRHQMWGQVGAGDIQQTFQRLYRIALGTQIKRDEVGLAAGKDRNRRSSTLEMSAVIQLGQCSLDGPVATVDGKNGGRNAGDRPHRFANLVGTFHLIMEDVGMLGAKGADTRKLGKIPRRPGVAQQGDPRPGHQLPAGPTPRPLI